MLAFKVSVSRTLLPPLVSLIIGIENHLTFSLLLFIGNSWNRYKYYFHVVTYLHLDNNNYFYYISSYLILILPYSITLRETAFTELVSGVLTSAHRTWVELGVKVRSLYIDV